MFDRLLHGPKDRQHAGTDPKRRFLLFLSYLPDWIITVALFGIIAGVADSSTGFRREFSLTDTSIQHSYAVHERVTFGEAIAIAGAVPAILIIVVGLGWRRSVWDVHNGLLGALAITTSLTEVIKVSVGRPRPDLIDRCQPATSAMNAIPYGLATSAICSGNLKSKIRLGFLSFYLAGKMHLFDSKGHAIKAWICVIPLMAATLVAISRTMDYRHHATDVLIGGILGLLIAYFTYSLYYPPLGSHKAHLPYSPRIARQAPNSAELPMNHHSSDADVPAGTVPRPVGGHGVGADGEEGYAADRV
ncbi:hypothetical protein RQP46_000351 [Phenoliferia psychrophenolica]